VTAQLGLRLRPGLQSPEQKGVGLDLAEFTKRLRVAWGEFVKGNPEPAKEAYSRKDDVTLANPFGPAVRGWDKVAETLDFASSRFSDGESSGFETLAEYASEDLVTILEIEHWRARVGDNQEVLPFDLRVTSTFRREENEWKLVHRHADPITRFDPGGPLRNSRG
jgi:ketosteroid isomerase-like protein